MNPNLFVFLGRTGCGKGTQSVLLSHYLKKKDASKDVFYVSTGDEFRKFMHTGTYTAMKTKEIIEEGGYVPSFLASMMWANVVAREFKENTHMILDGSPRTLAEKEIFDTLFYFYGKPTVFDFEKVHIIYINVSGEWATEKLLKRMRQDDTDALIKNRMVWFEENIMPVINKYKDEKNIVFHEIDGEQSIEKVHQDLISSLKH